VKKNEMEMKVVIERITLSMEAPHKGGGNFFDKPNFLNHSRT
jgi:hypothetical protein